MWFGSTPSLVPNSHLRNLMYLWFHIPLLLLWYSMAAPFICNKFVPKSGVLRAAGVWYLPPPQSGREICATVNHYRVEDPPSSAANVCKQ